MTETSYAAGVAFPRAESRPWLRWVGTIAGVLLGIVLIYSAWGKALDPLGIGAFFARKGLLPAGLAGPAIMLTVAVEARRSGSRCSSTCAAGRCCRPQRC